MILILTDEDEPTTDLVIDWLNYFKKKFLRISRYNIIKIQSIFFENNEMEALLQVHVNNKKVMLDTRDVTSYWYRRSNFYMGYEKVLCDDKNIEFALNDFLRSESFDAIKIINNIFNRKSRINSYDDNAILKIEELETAKSVGLSVPDTIICSNKKLLAPFFKKYKNNIITKTIGDPCSFFPYNYTVNTNKVKLNDLDENFGLTLFQEMIEKQVELRIFALNGQFYSSAIFSQSHEKTMVDLKNYDIERPNRVVPFLLPDSIADKIKTFMDKLNLNSGSIDMVITPDLEYIFLEINPIGQFEQVAMPCNYNLFRIVAENLN